MARSYSIRSFFRQTPNALLARYFERQGLLQEFDFSAMKETKVEALFKAWLELPEERRNDIEREFHTIFNMSSENGFLAILDEARWHLTDDIPVFLSLSEKLSALPGHYHRAMITYLDHNTYWQGATRFYHADTLSYWRKRKNMGSQPACVDKDTRQQFAKMISHYFQQTEARGHHCIVEVYRRNDLDYFFVHIKDHSQEHVEWIDGEIQRRPHNPSFEIVFVYSQENGALDLNCRGLHKSVEALQSFFAKVILKLDTLPPNPKDKRVYNLNPLVHKDFAFQLEIGGDIQQVFIKKLRLSSKVNRGERIILEGDIIQDISITNTSMSQLVEQGLWNVTQVELEATMTTQTQNNDQTITFRITHPNFCSLEYDEPGLKLRRMLENSGIEPKKPTEEVEDIAA